MTTHHLETKIFHTTFGRNEPALRVQSGDTIIVETRDARGNDQHGNPLPDSMRPRPDGFEYSTSNPLVGPVYIDGTEPGDSLAVHIDKIELNRATAWSSHSPNFGSLTGEQSSRRLLLNDPLPRLLFDWSLDLSRQVGVLELKNSRAKKIELPLHPFIGSIGVAPRYGRVETALTPGEYGGNMDCVETREGTTIYFPVWARGAYLAFGDIHAAQGDGEVCGSALETTAQVQLRVEVQKNRAIEWPRMEDENYLMTTGSLHSLIDAVRVAQVEMLNWLMSDYGFEKWEFQWNYCFAVPPPSFYQSWTSISRSNNHTRKRGFLQPVNVSQQCKALVIARMTGAFICAPCSVMASTKTTLVEL